KACSRLRPRAASHLARAARLSSLGLETASPTLLKAVKPLRESSLDSWSQESTADPDPVSKTTERKALERKLQLLRGRARFPVCLLKTTGAQKGCLGAAPAGPPVVRRYCGCGFLR
ncbi:Hypothetical predicted protein, partial [Marmota monax]